MDSLQNKAISSVLEEKAAFDRLSPIPLLSGNDVDAGNIISKDEFQVNYNFQNDGRYLNLDKDWETSMIDNFKRFNDNIKEIFDAIRQLKVEASQRTELEEISFERLRKVWKEYCENLRKVRNQGLRNTISILVHVDEKLKEIMAQKEEDHVLLTEEADDICLDGTRIVQK
jgi:flagellar biosynthesis regulator FlaF